MKKHIFRKLSNPLLFYNGKGGRSIFKNYNLVDDDGYIYEENYSISTAGVALEYRMETDKKMKLISFIAFVLLYLVYINNSPSIFVMIMCIVLWIAITVILRILASKLYDKFLIKTFGKFKITDFNPPVSKDKSNHFKRSFIARIFTYIFVILLFFTPAVLMYHIVRMDISSKSPHFKLDIALVNIYNFIYPKIDTMYDMSAYAKYKTEDYQGAIRDYKHVLKMEGKKFSQKDYTRFANLMYLHKKLYGTQLAVDIFNEYATKKKMNISEESQMLWIKSLFSINNDLTTFVISDYDNLIMSLKDSDIKNRFYITSDKAYMLSLIGEYDNAIECYNELISFVKNNEEYSKELPRLIIERGYTKRMAGDKLGADDDFVQSGVDMYEIESYKPNPGKKGFIVDNF